MAWKSPFRQNYRTTFSPTVPTSTAGISHVVADVEASGGEKWEHLKSGGKQWQATPKNLARMQRTRAIPVAWMNSCFCPNRPKGWIPIIIIMKGVLLVASLVTVSRSLEISTLTEPRDYHTSVTAYPSYAAGHILRLLASNLYSFYPQNSVDDEPLCKPHIGHRKNWCAPLPTIPNDGWVSFGCSCGRQFESCASVAGKIHRRTTAQMH